MGVSSLLSKLTKTQKLLALVMVIIILVAGASYYALSVVEEEPIELIDFDCDRCYADVEALTSIGPRMAGTTGELQGAEYVREQFLEAGLANVKIEYFRYPLFEVDRADVSLVEYTGIVYPRPNPLSTPIEFEHKVEGNQLLAYW